MRVSSSRFTTVLIAIVCFFSLLPSAVTSTMAQGVQSTSKPANVTSITGTLTSRRANMVQVRYEPHSTAAPALGDRVIFTRLVAGLEARAEGTVTEVSDGIASVNVTQGRPDFDSNVVIYATGSAFADTPPAPGFRRVLVDQNDRLSPYEIDVPDTARIESKYPYQQTVLTHQLELLTIERDPFNYLPDGDILATHQMLIFRLRAILLGRPELDQGVRADGNYPEIPNPDGWTTLWRDRAITGRARCYATAWRRALITGDLMIFVEATCTAGDELYITVTSLIPESNWPAREQEVMDTIRSLRVVPR